MKCPGDFEQLPHKKIGRYSHRTLHTKVSKLISTFFDSFPSVQTLCKAYGWEFFTIKIFYIKIILTLM
jgi:hypothetical protein